MRDDHPLLDGARDLFLLFFPHNCQSCGKALYRAERIICLHCAHRLPESGFHHYRTNPVYRSFHGRLPLESASSFLLFSKGGNARKLMHAFKYGGKKEIGEALGRMYARRLQESDAGPPGADLIVPVPIHFRRKRLRGYNQSDHFAMGLSEGLGIPWNGNLVQRTRHRKSQTAKSRLDRYANIEGSFRIGKAAELAGRHLLLVDDVITTGATLEALGRELLKLDGVRLSILSIAFAD